MPEFIIGARGHDFGRHTPEDLLTSIGKAGFRCTQLAYTKAIEGVKSYADITPELVEATKAAVAALAPITADKFTTVVFTRDNINEWLSVRNIPTVHPIFVDQLNTYDVITSQYVVFTKEAFEAFVAAKTEPKEA